MEGLADGKPAYFIPYILTTKAALTSAPAAVRLLLVGSDTLCFGKTCFSCQEGLTTHLACAPFQRDVCPLVFVRVAAAPDACSQQQKDMLPPRVHMST